MANSGSDGGGWAYTPPSYSQVKQQATGIASAAASERLSEAYDKIKDMLDFKANPGQKELYERAYDPYMSYALGCVVSNADPNWEEYDARLKGSTKTEPIEGFLVLLFVEMLIIVLASRKIVTDMIVGTLIGSPLFLVGGEDWDGRRRRPRRKGESRADYERRMYTGGSERYDPYHYPSQQWQSTEKQLTKDFERAARGGQYGPKARASAMRRATGRFFKKLLPGK